MGEEAASTEYASRLMNGGMRDEYRLAPHRLRELTRIDRIKTVQHIALEWSGIVLAALVCEDHFSWQLWVIACVFIGSRLHALGILAHDGTHGLLWPAKRTNDLLVECLLAWPVFLSLPAYRRMHRLHHRFLNTKNDPDFARNRPDRLVTRRGVWEFLRVMGGLYGEQSQMLRFVAAGERPDRPEAERPLVPRWIIYACIIGPFAASGSLDLVLKYWIAPFGTWFLFSMRLKGTAEHFAVEGNEACNSSRTLDAGFLSRLFIAPKNVHLHIEHHLYPSVPFHRLPELHAALMEFPEYRRRAHLTTSYPRFLWECFRFRDARAVPQQELMTSPAKGVVACEIKDLPPMNSEP